jgi:hypothetical protein
VGIGPEVTLEEMVERNHSKFVQRLDSYTELSVSPVNEVTFSTGESVTDMINEGWKSFTLRDGYVFFPEEWHYLLRTSKNPFTNQVLDEKDKLRLTHLYSDYFTHWVYFDVTKLPKMEYNLKPGYETELNDISCKIDAFLEESQMVPYGNRFGTRISSIPDIEKMKIFIMTFLTSPALYSGMPGLSEYDREMLLSCISFSPIKGVDSTDLDEINLYFNMKTQAILRIQDCQPRLLLRTIMEWIYAVLETTKLHSPRLFEGRCLTVNYSLFTLH